MSLNDFIAAFAGILSIALIVALYKIYQLSHDAVIIDKSDIQTKNGAPIYMDAMQARGMIANYKANHLRVINADPTLTALRGDPTRTSDARSAWFEYNRLLNFLLEIKEKSGVADTSTLGVRIYYAEYPSADLFNAAGPNPNMWQDMAASYNRDNLTNYAGMHNVVLVPTNEIGGTHTDFTIRFGDNTPSMTTIDNIYAPGFVAAATGNQVLMLDHSSLKPPPYDGSLAGTGARVLDIVDGAVPVPTP